MKKHSLFFPALLYLIFPLCLSGQINSTLIQHIEKSEFQKIDSLLQTGINLHATDENGANALMWACYLSNAEMVIHLFEKGARAPKNGGIYPNKKKNQWYGDLLAVAAGQGKTDITRYLLEEQKWPVDAQPLHSDIDSLSGWTALMHAANNFDINRLETYINAEIISILINGGANPTLKNENEKQAPDLSRDVVVVDILTHMNMEKLALLVELHKLANNSLEHFYKERFLEAIDYCNELLGIVKTIYGDLHPAYFSWLGNQAAFYNYAGFFEEALPLYHETIDFYERTLGEEHQYLGTQLSNLAKCNKDLGNYGKAIENYEHAILITRKNPTVNPTSLVIRLNGLGHCYRVMNRFDEALQLHNEALEISEKYKEKDPADYAECLTHLASLYHDRRELEKALQISKEAIDFSKKSYGEWHSNYGFRIGKHAEIHADMGKAEEALTFSLKSLEIADSILGKKHRFYGDSKLTLANIYHQLNDYEKAGTAYEDVLTNIFGIINNNFPYVSEANQLSWRNRFAYRQDLINSFYLKYKSVVPSLVTYNITLKGLTIKGHQDFTRDELKPQYQRWLELKKIIGLQLSKAKAGQNLMLDKWTKEADEIETLLASESKNFANQKKVVSIEDLRAQLKPDEAIIDFVHFNYYDIDRKTDSVIYVAYLIRPENGNMELIPLFEEKALMALIDSSIGQQEMVEALYASRGAVKGGRKNQENLSALIWTPILPFLKPYKKLYISPSGLLHKFNLGAISTEKGDLIMDRFQVLQFNSLKSMQDHYDKVNVKSYLLVGDVHYDYTEQDMETEVLTPRGSAETDVLELRSVTADSWQQLIGTQKEILAIEEVLKVKNSFETVTLKGSDATEENIKARLSGSFSPGCVHFSTHGFFFPDAGFDPDKSIAFKASDNPMIRSGLILAGANYTWQNGNLLPGRADDGVLTAYEVANLNLSNTELVVLSACETGLGDIQGSEGVFGLQRAFKIAGARYILMSLWQVPDEATQKLMTLFYKNWLNGMEIYEALKNAQDKLRSRKSYGHPYFWSGFVLIE